MIGARPWHRQKFPTPHYRRDPLGSLAPPQGGLGFSLVIHTIRTYEYYLSLARLYSLSPPPRAVTTATSSAYASLQARLRLSLSSTVWVVGEVIEAPSRPSGFVLGWAKDKQTRAPLAPHPRES